MIAARGPSERPLDNRLLVVGARDGELKSKRVADLGSWLGAGDLLVVNDAATFPGALSGHTESGSPVEARLMREIRPGRWEAAVLGAGDWRMRTEDRPDPIGLEVGSRVVFGAGSAEMEGVVVRVLAPRRIEIEFAPFSFWAELYRVGKPIQYSYLRNDLELWSAQTAYASRPWAAEMPSAGHALRWELLLSLRKKGVGLTWLTHAAGISSTGNAKVDRRLPFGERYLIPEQAVRAIRDARRVIAVGTSVVRALEGCRLRNGEVIAGEGTTGLRLGRSFRPRVVDGLITGMHELGESHFRLLEAFAPRALLLKALELAEREGFKTHEFGDSCLVLP